MPVRHPNEPRRRSLLLPRRARQPAGSLATNAAAAARLAAAAAARLAAKPAFSWPRKVAAVTGALPLRLAFRRFAVAIIVCRYEDNQPVRIQVQIRRRAGAPFYPLVAVYVLSYAPPAFAVTSPCSRRRSRAGGHAPIDEQHPDGRRIKSRNVRPTAAFRTNCFCHFQVGRSHVKQRYGLR
jgi:hypothetical protein